MGNFLWGIHHQEFPWESQWRIHHGEFTMGNSPWIWFPGHSSWIHQFAWGKESDSPRGIPHGELSCGEFMWIFPVNSPQVSNEQYCNLNMLVWHKKRGWMREEVGRKKYRKRDCTSTSSRLANKELIWESRLRLQQWIQELSDWSYKRVLLCSQS